MGWLAKTKWGVNFNLWTERLVHSTSIGHGLTLLLKTALESTCCTEFCPQEDFSQLTLWKGICKAASMTTLVEQICLHSSENHPQENYKQGNWRQASTCLRRLKNVKWKRILQLGQRCYVVWPHCDMQAVWLKHKTVHPVTQREFQKVDFTWKSMFLPH